MLTADQKELLAKKLLLLMEQGWGKMELEASDHHLSKVWVGPCELFPKEITACNSN